jgi:hypothetical protein
MSTFFGGAVGKRPLAPASEEAGAPPLSPAVARDRGRSRLDHSAAADVAAAQGGEMAEGPMQPGHTDVIEPCRAVP